MSIKKEVRSICRKLKIEIDFNSKNWKNDFINKANWIKVSEYQFLSVIFCKEFADNLHWITVGACQRGEFFLEIMKLNPHQKNGLQFRIQSSS
jgi:hypothetical protein